MMRHSGPIESLFQRAIVIDDPTNNCGARQAEQQDLGVTGMVCAYISDSPVKCIS